MDQRGLNTPTGALQWVGGFTKKQGSGSSENQSGMAAVALEVEWVVYPSDRLWFYSLLLWSEC